jgi:hypothetical protein
MATVKLQVFVQVSRVGSRVQEEIDTGIEQAEWDAMPDHERDSIADEIARDWLFENVDTGWTAL